MIEHFTLTPPMQIGAWLGCLFFVVALWNQVSKAWRNARGPAPQPPNEALAVGHSDLDRRMTKAEQEIQQLKTDADRKHEKLRLEIKADLDKQTERFEARFDDLPERVILLLKNTGAIGGHRRSAVDD
jgi:hypothetical protein